MAARSVLLLATAALSAATVPTVQLCTPATRPNRACYAMPVVGQGSCCGSYNISSWLAQGGTHIDTSVDYGSQPDIAGAIAASGIPREKLWITSKLNVESCATNMTAALFELVLAPLQTTYVDLLLLHHAGRWETDNDPRPACFDPTLAGTLGSYYKCRMATIQVCGGAWRVAVLNAAVLCGVARAPSLERPPPGSITRQTDRSILPRPL